MISSEVQRTLVKSPPELWAELSDPVALARHLGELGEIRITRAEPERRVEWEAEGASGTVLIKASGWGTKVTLTVSREVALAEAGEAIVAEMPETGAVPEASAILETDTAPETAPVEPAAPLTETQDQLEPTQEAREEPLDETPLEPEPEPRRGFFARLFGRRRPKATALPEMTSATTSRPIAERAEHVPSEPHPDLDPERAMPETSVSAIESLQARFQAEPVVDLAQEAEAEPAARSQEVEALVVPPEAEMDASENAAAETAEPPLDMAAELEAAEEVAVEEVTALLTGVLDRLGAAHHRPFSRA